ncbi:MAG: hypothetical protein SVY15_06215 [Halobacteriota archaeon]|nr:hypothetical protein [Halobacteriota archaeon]
MRVSQGLDEENYERQLNVVARELTFTMSKDEIEVGETTTLTVKGPSSDAINVISSQTGGEFVGGFYEQVVDAPIETTQVTSTNWSLGDDSTYQVVVRFNAKGTYKLTVNDVTDTYVASKSITIKVGEGEITVDVPSSATIGEEVKIKGTTTLRENTDIGIIVENRYNVIVDSKHNVDITKGYFEWDWDTSDINAGYYKVTAFWDEDSDNTLDSTEDTKDIKSIRLERKIEPPITDS